MDEFKEEDEPIHFNRLFKIIDSQRTPLLLESGKLFSHKIPATLRDVFNLKSLLKEILIQYEKDHVTSLYSLIVKAASLLEQKDFSNSDIDYASSNIIPILLKCYEQRDVINITNAAASLLCGIAIVDSRTHYILTKNDIIGNFFYAMESINIPSEPDILLTIGKICENSWDSVENFNVSKFVRFILETDQIEFAYPSAYLLMAIYKHSLEIIDNSTTISLIEHIIQSGVEDIDFYICTIILILTSKNSFFLPSQIILEYISSLKDKYTPQVISIFANLTLNNSDFGRKLPFEFEFLDSILNDIIETDIINTQTLFSACLCICALVQGNHIESNVCSQLITWIIVKYHDLSATLKEAVFLMFMVCLPKTDIQVIVDIGPNLFLTLWTDGLSHVDKANEKYTLLSLCRFLKSLLSTGMDIYSLEEWSVLYDQFQETKSLIEYNSIYEELEIFFE